MYCYIRLAWLSRTSIAVTSGRINQNSLGSFCYIPNQSELAESPRPLSDTKKLASPLVPYIAAWNSTHHLIRVAALGMRCLSGPLRLSSAVFNLFPRTSDFGAGKIAATALGRTRILWSHNQYLQDLSPNPFRRAEPIQ